MPLSTWLIIKWIGSEFRAQMTVFDNGCPVSVHRSETDVTHMAGVRPCIEITSNSLISYTRNERRKGLLSIAEEDANGKCQIVDQIKTKKSARTIINNPETHEVYLPAADFGTPVSGQRPPVIPGTFQILVFGKTN